MDYNNGNYDKKQEQEIQESFAKELFNCIATKVNRTKVSTTPSNRPSELFKTLNDSPYLIV